MGSTTIYLVRHGETDWNASGRWQGHTDVPLNEVGEAQARLLAARLAGEVPPFSALVTSDLVRASRTAAILGAALGLTPVEEPDLREIDVGSWGGLTTAEVAASDPDTHARVQRGEDLPRGGAERLADLQARVGAAFDRLALRHAGGRLLLVTHGGPARAILGHAFPGRAELASPSLRVGNASLSILALTPRGWELRLLDDVSHLAGARQAPDVMFVPRDGERA